MTSWRTYQFVGLDNECLLVLWHEFAHIEVFPIETCGPNESLRHQVGVHVAGGPTIL